MAWQDVPAFSKTTGRAMVSAYLKRGVAGETKMHLLLSSFVTDKLGDPATVGVQFGSGEHLGQVRVVVAKGTKPDAQGGVHKVSNGFKGGKRILLPWFEGLPKGSCKAVACAIIIEAAGELIVKLPIADWEIAISKANALPPSGFPPKVAPAPAVNAQPPARAAPPAAAVKTSIGATPSGKVNLVEYLTGKGHKVARLAGGLFLVSGDRVTAKELLELVNSHRSRNDLPPLGAEDVE